MAKTEIDFAEFANTFYDIIDGRKSNKAEFVKMLLKMGMSKNGKQVINEMFPTETNSKGDTVIISSKADRLRKYLRGVNGIGDISGEIHASFDYENYIDELEDYDDAKLIAFAQKLQTGADLDNVDDVRRAIADCYCSIIEKASPKKVPETNKTKDSKNIVLSYTITESEKEAVIRLCELIKKALSSIRHKTDTIDKKQFQLNNLTDSEADAKWKLYLEYELASLKKELNKSYTELEKLCADVFELLQPKKDIHTSFGTIISIAGNIHSEEYKITSPEKFNYNSFSVMISRFNNSYDRLLRDIDKL